VTKTFIILFMRPSWPIHPTVLYLINLIIVEVQSMKLLLCNFPHSAFTAFNACYSSHPPRDHVMQPYRTWGRCTGQYKRTVRFQKLIRNVFLVLHGHNITVSSGNWPSFSCATSSSFLCLLRGRGSSFQDGVSAVEGFLCAPFWGVQICDYNATRVSCTV
jgi:hypothetical protein